MDDRCKKLIFYEKNDLVIHVYQLDDIDDDNDEDVTDEDIDELKMKEIDVIS